MSIQRYEFDGTLYVELVEHFAELESAKKQVEVMAVALTMACELHGCASINCTAARYREDGQRLIDKNTELESQVESVRLAGAKEMQELAAHKIETLRELYPKQMLAKYVRSLTLPKKG